MNEERKEECQRWFSDKAKKSHTMTVRLLRGNTSERDELEQATTSPPHSRRRRVFDAAARFWSSLREREREREREKKKSSPNLVTRARRRRGEKEVFRRKKSLLF